MIGLSYIRNIKNITLEDLANKLGIKKQNVNGWEKGNRPIPQKYLPLLRDIFGIPEEYFQKELSEIDIVELQTVLNTQEAIAENTQSDEISDSDMLAIQKLLLEEYEVLERILETNDIESFQERFLSNPNILKIFVNKSKMESQIYIRNFSVKVINLSQQDQFSFDQIKELNLMAKLLQLLYLITCEMPSDYISKSIEALNKIIGGHDTNEI